MTLNDYLKTQKVSKPAKTHGGIGELLKKQAEVDASKKREFDNLSDTYPAEHILSMVYKRDYKNATKYCVNIYAQKNSEENDAENKYNIIIRVNDNEIALPVEFVEEFACELLNTYDKYIDANEVSDKWQQAHNLQKK